MTRCELLHIMNNDRVKIAAELPAALPDGRAHLPLGQNLRLEPGAPPLLPVWPAVCLHLGHPVHEVPVHVPRHPHLLNRLLPGHCLRWVSSSNPGKNGYLP
jgi:hypothetical protein